MEDYIIVVNKIEELQTIKDVQALELIFEKAKRTIIGGNAVVLVRSLPAGGQERFDTITTEETFEQYRNQVFKHL